MQSDAAIPKLSGDIRPLIPKLGLRNYWYPAVVERKVGWPRSSKRGASLLFSAESALDPP